MAEQEVGLFTTEYGLIEIEQSQLYGRRAPNPVQYAKIQKQITHYLHEHPGLQVFRDDRSALNGGLVLVWMPRSLHEVYTQRLKARAMSYTVRRFFADLENEQTRPAVPEHLTLQIDSNRAGEPAPREKCRLPYAHDAHRWDDSLDGYTFKWCEGAAEEITDGEH